MEIPRSIRPGDVWQITGLDLELESWGCLGGLPLARIDTVGLCPTVTCGRLYKYEAGNGASCDV